MRYSAFFFIIFLFPHIAFALCSEQGTTVVYVNGVLTGFSEAKNDLLKLQNKYQSNYSEQTDFINGYNPSHLAGLGDWIKSVEQAYRGEGEVPVNDYDLQNILVQIHDQVTTQKILLVGHSQGTFYTNALHEYLINHGVPKESIAVYNLATPASFVAGGGKYLTSANDRLIGKVRELAAAGGAKEPLQANILIPLPAEHLNDPWGGHHFSSDYLAGAPLRIVSEINSGLEKLRSLPREGDGCFSPPAQTLSFTLQKFAFLVADPMANIAYATASAGYNAAALAVKSVGDTLASVFKETNEDDLAVVGQSASAITALAEELVPEESGSDVVVQELPPVESVSEPVLETIQVNSDATLEISISSTTVAIPEPSFGPTFSIPAAGFGGGGVPPPAAELSEPEVSAPTPPASPVVTTPASFSVPFATSSIAFAGTAVPSSVVSTDFSAATTSVDTSGNWALELSGFSEGPTTINFYTTEGDLTSSAAQISFSIDTVAPDVPVLSIAECTTSFTTGSCTTRAGVLNFSWTASAGAEYYELRQDTNLLTTTTALSASTTVAVGTYSFEVVAYDSALNSTTSTAVAVSAVTLPSIGYYCSPYISTYEEGRVYTHTGTDCRYQSSSISVISKGGDLYKGTLGAASLINGHSLGSSNNSLQTNDGDSTAVAGDTFFTVIYEKRTGPAFSGDQASFRSFFQTNANAPPHLNFGILNWVYGP